VFSVAHIASPGERLDPQDSDAPTNSYADGELVRTRPIGDTNVRVPSRAKLSCQPWSCHKW